MNLREIWRAAFERGEERGVAAGAAFRAEVAARLDDAREEREARIRAEAYAAGREAGIAARTPAGIARVERHIARRVAQEVRDAADVARFTGRTEAYYAVTRKIADMFPAAPSSRRSCWLALDDLRAWVENEREVVARRARGAGADVVPIRRGGA